MGTELQVEPSSKNHFCPECGAQEDGFFCRSCGKLLRGEERILCPRCHQVVPAGEFCNQCGQSLGGLALSLRQLAMAGDTFWVTSEAVEPSPSPEPTPFAPDETVKLAAPELPDWLQELPTREASIEVESHIYPALQPIRGDRGAASSNSFLIVVVIFMFVLLLGLVGLSLFILLTRGG